MNHLNNPAMRPHVRDAILAANPMPDDQLTAAVDALNPGDLVTVTWENTGAPLTEPPYTMTGTVNLDWGGNKCVGTKPLADYHGPRRGLLRVDRHPDPEPAEALAPGAGLIDPKEKP